MEVWPVYGSIGLESLTPKLGRYKRLCGGAEVPAQGRLSPSSAGEETLALMSLRLGQLSGVSLTVSSPTTLRNGVKTLPWVSVTIVLRSVFGLLFSTPAVFLLTVQSGKSLCSAEGRFLCDRHGERALCPGPQSL